MEHQDWLAHTFEEHRPHLQAVAYHVLGSLAEADDAVQEAWLRLSHTDVSEVANLGGWLTTVVARISLNMLRDRHRRREESWETTGSEPSTSTSDQFDPEHEALLADSIGLALCVVLERLTPAERLAFVLHDIFAVPFEDIAPIVERAVATTRQLASRARHRIQGAGKHADADLTANRAIVDAFLAASRAGNFAALLALLDPNMVYRADWAVGKSQFIHGATAVVKQARAFLPLARFAQAALVNGAVGVIVAPYGRLRYVAQVTITGGKIAQIHVIADSAMLRQVHLAILSD